MYIFNKRYFVSYIVIKNGEVDGYGSVLCVSRLRGAKLYKQTEQDILDGKNSDLSIVFVAFNRL